MIGPNPADLEAMKANTDVKVLSQPGLNIVYWSFNVQKPPFDKKEVRQALSMAIDKAAIIKDVYQGTGAVGRRTSSRRPSGLTTTRSRTTPMTLRRPRRC